MGFHHHPHDGHDHGHGHGHRPGHAGKHRHGDPSAPGSARPHQLAEAGLIERSSETRRLTWVLVATAAFMVAEVVGGVLSGSLALLADAGHMFTDAGSLALSLFAMRLALRPPSLRRTYGYVRVEMLAALVNGSTLLVIAGVIVFEAWQRFQSPVEIDAPVMLVVAVLGLGVNVLGATLLHGHAHDNLNMRGAYLHVLGDLLGSVGAIVAGVVILTTGWTPADAIVSVVIALLILVGAWRLVRESVEVLLEAVPPHIDMDSVLKTLCGIDGLDDVHDVHVWTLTSGFVALSGHGVIDDPADHNRVLERVQETMADHGISHVTFQLEFRTLYQIPSAGGQL